MLQKSRNTLLIKMVPGNFSKKHSAICFLAYFMHSSFKSLHSIRLSKYCINITSVCVKSLFSWRSMNSSLIDFTFFIDSESTSLSPKKKMHIQMKTSEDKGQRINEKIQMKAANLFECGCHKFVNFKSNGHVNDVSECLLDKDYTNRYGFIMRNTMCLIK